MTDDLEGLISELASALESEPRTVALKQAIDFLESDREAMDLISEIEENQRACRKNERNPSIRMTSLKAISEAAAALEKRPSWVNFCAAYRERKDLAESILEAVENA